MLRVGAGHASSLAVAESGLSSYAPIGFKPVIIINFDPWFFPFFRTPTWSHVKYGVREPTTESDPYDTSYFEPDF
jgi:hypothetical protein